MTLDLSTAPDTLLSAMVFVLREYTAGRLTTEQVRRRLAHMLAMCRAGLEGIDNGTEV